MKWTAGVITAPREKGYYLDRTLCSLRRGGWPDPVVFAEPDSPLPEKLSSQAVVRRKRFGDWTNWATGLYELFLSEPDTELFLMAEDDAVFCTNARTYVEHALPHLGDFGSLSLYTPSRYYRPNRPRTFHNECEGKTTWSTVAVVMSHHSVWRFFSDPEVQKHRFHDIFQVDPGFWRLKASYGKGKTSLIDTEGNTLKDAVIGQWASRLNLPVYYHTPSLAEHIGNFSTLTDDESTVANGRMSADFVGEDFDAMVWVGQPVSVRRFKNAQLS